MYCLPFGKIRVIWQVHVIKMVTSYKHGLYWKINYQNGIRPCWRNYNMNKFPVNFANVPTDIFTLLLTFILPNIWIEIHWTCHIYVLGSFELWNISQVNHTQISTQVLQFVYVLNKARNVNTYLLICSYCMFAYICKYHSK